VARDHAIARIDLIRQAEGGRAVGDEPVELDEAALVEQEIEPLAGGELPLPVLLGDARRAAAQLGVRLAVLELLEEPALVGHGGQYTKQKRPVVGGASFAVGGRAQPSVAAASDSSYTGRTGGMIGSSG
jgi:hypothetical protein